MSSETRDTTELTSCPPTQVTVTGSGHGGHGRHTTSMLTAVPRGSSHGPALVDEAFSGSCHSKANINSRLRGAQPIKRTSHWAKLGWNRCSCYTVIKLFRNISDIRPIISSTKAELCNVLKCCRRITEPRHAKKIWCSLDMWFLRYACGHTVTHSSQ